MNLFGFKRLKPIAATRFSGLGYLRLKSRDATRAGPVQFLRHASAVSAAIAKNMTAMMNQPGELLHQSGSKSDSTSFLENHNHYSFIAMVALMSLFLVVTISATGLLLAFCRKKNSVFTAAPKSDMDSQFELDDIESSDLEMCRGDKGECYYHLSDDYDDDEDEEEEENGDEDSELDGQRERRGKNKSYCCTKRSRTFPQIHNGTANGKNTANSDGVQTCTAKDKKRSNALTPLIRHGRCRRGQGQLAGTEMEDSSSKEFRVTRTSPICRNPHHSHRSAQHYYRYQNHAHRHCHSRHHNSNNDKWMGRHHLARLYRNQLPRAGGSRLQRSHTIHAIPQTGSESKSMPSSDTCQVKIQVHGADAMFLASVPGGTMDPLETLPQSSTEIDDIFDDAADVKSFNNLKLRLDNSAVVENSELSSNDGPPDLTRVEVIVHQPSFHQAGVSPSEFEAETSLDKIGNQFRENIDTLTNISSNSAANETAEVNHHASEDSFSSPSSESPPPINDTASFSLGFSSTQSNLPRGLAPLTSPIASSSVLIKDPTSLQNQNISLQPSSQTPAASHIPLSIPPPPKTFTKRQQTRQWRTKGETMQTVTQRGKTPSQNQNTLSQRGAPISQREATPVDNSIMQDAFQSPTDYEPSMSSGTTTCASVSNRDRGHFDFRQQQNEQTEMASSDVEHKLHHRHPESQGYDQGGQGHMYDDVSEDDDVHLEILKDEYNADDEEDDDQTTALLK